uniref:Uncharacterized protein n=1 Tax=Mycena chlorophos TaxID=658473 RepID=A0ABQ0LFA9_MYCCL|nr:predicted protein [Mycena chlorophos]
MSFDLIDDLNFFQIPPDAEREDDEKLDPGPLEFSEEETLEDKDESSVSDGLRRGTAIGADFVIGAMTVCSISRPASGGDSSTVGTRRGLLVGGEATQLLSVSDCEGDETEGEDEIPCSPSSSGTDCTGGAGS